MTETLIKKMQELDGGNNKGFSLHTYMQGVADCIDIVMREQKADHIGDADEMVSSTLNRCREAFEKEKAAWRYGTPNPRHIWDQAWHAGDEEVATLKRLIENEQALRRSEIPLMKPTEAMCDEARGFLVGLNLGIRNFRDMRLHLERGGYSNLPCIIALAIESPAGHITKLDVADCIWQLMARAHPVPTPKRESGKAYREWREYPSCKPFQIDPHSPVSHPLAFLTESGDESHIRLGYYDFRDGGFYESGVEGSPYHSSVTRYFRIPYPMTKKVNSIEEA